MTPTHKHPKPSPSSDNTQRDYPITAWDVYRKRVNDNTLPMRFWVIRVTLLAVILGVLGKFLLSIL